ncbi:hypothetical protein ACJX0J_020265, partial [Zea mays]
RTAKGRDHEGMEIVDDEDMIDHHLNKRAIKVIVEDLGFVYIIDYKMHNKINVYRKINTFIFKIEIEMKDLNMTIITIAIG